MKPRTKFEKTVAASNERLAAISSKAVDWAIRNVVKHISFRTSGHKCTCGDCGGEFDYKGKGKSARCPHCGHRLQTVDTLARKNKEACYFSTLEAVDGMQVQRVFLLTVNYRKGKPMEAFCNEVCRLWLDCRHFIGKDFGLLQGQLQLGFIHRTEEHDRCSLGYLQYIRLSLLFRHT